MNFDHQKTFPPEIVKCAIEGLRAMYKDEY